MKMLLAPNIELKDWVAVLALIISVLSYLNTWQEKERSRKEAVVKSLLGEKETVAHMAYKISNKEWPASPADADARDEVIASLCFAWIFESSNRARALVLAALKEMNEGYHDQIGSLLERIALQFSDYARLVSPEESDMQSDESRAVARGRKRLVQLRNELGMKNLLSEGDS
jgi:hypothetical protein